MLLNRVYNMDRELDVKSTSLGAWYLLSGCLDVEALVKLKGCKKKSRSYEFF